MDVQSDIPHQHLGHVLGAVEAVGFEDICNAFIKTLYHPMGLGRSGVGQSVFNTQRFAQLIKLVFPAGFSLPAGKQAVLELLAVVGQQLLNSDRASFVQRLEETAGTVGRLVPFDLHKHPARGAVHGYEQAAALALIGHLRQVLHVHVQVDRRPAHRF